MKKVIVVGAGTAGLAAAVRLQVTGYEVHLIEKNPRVGGKMYRIEEDGFTFDVGPTIVMTPDIYDEVFIYAGRNPRDYFNLIQLDPAMGVSFRDGTSLSLSSDLVKLIKTLEDISDKDASGMMSYLANVYERFLVAKNKILNRSYRNRWDLINPKSLKDLYDLKTLNTAYKELEKYIDNEYLLKAFAFQTLYIGISPQSGPSLYNMIVMMELFYGVWFIEGGMHEYALAMARLFEELGGRLYLNHNVDEILIENGEAIGVIVDGEEVLADYVVVNQDFPSAMVDLIPDETNRGKYTNEFIDQMDYTCSCYLLYVGTDKEYETEAAHSFYITEDFEKNIEDIFDSNHLPTDPSIYIYNMSKINDQAAPEGRYAYYILIPVPNLDSYNDWSPEATNEFRKTVFDIIHNIEGFEDFEEHIVFERAYTPENFEENFNAYRGATFGLQPTLQQSAYFRPHNKFNYAENLYFCGSSIHPGAGVPTVLQSAMLTTEELLKDDRS